MCPKFNFSKHDLKWEEAVNSINFSHSSQKVWSTINTLTGRSGCSFCLCPVLANSIASQLVKNGARKTESRESTRLVNKELSNLWKVPTPEGKVSLALSGQRNYSSCCPQLPETKKVCGSGFYLPGVYTQCQVGSQILILRFSSLLHAPTQNSKDLEKSTNSCDPYARKATGGPKELSSHISAVRPLQNPQKTHLRLCRPNHRPIAPAGAGGLFTRKVDRRPSYPAGTGHRG